MNPGDLSDERLHAAFAARLDAAPEPSAMMRARTLAAIVAETEPSAPAWGSVARAWAALAAPARFATAAAIVIVGGTIAFGTVKATHDRPTGADASPETRISFDRRGRIGPHLARSAAVELDVRDIDAATRAVGRLAQRERGAIVGSHAVGTATGARRATRIELRVPSAGLRSTLAQLATLGTLRSRRVDARDLAAQLTANETALASARRHGENRDVDGLIAQRARLEARVDNATIAVILRNPDIGTAAMTRANPRQAELSRPNTRPTRIALTGEARCCKAPPVGPRSASRSLYRSPST